MSRLRSNIDLVDECDNFPYSDSTFAASQHGPAPSYFKFKLDGCTATLGLVLPDTVEKLPMTDLWTKDEKNRELVFKPAPVPADSGEVVRHRDHLLAEYLRHVRASEIFQILKGWRNELYPVYGPSGELLFSMERSASALFGIVTYGVHLTAYVETADGMKIWAPKRAPTKQTYPNMMDNTVAGGLSTGEKPFDCMIRESMEEASLPEHTARNARSCGTMTYFHVRDERAGGEVGLCQPECQFVYDLVLPTDVIPRPGDDEAIDFQLLSVREVQEAMANGRFKPNCALLLVEFFVRHGIITPENEPNYLEILSRLHRRFDFPMGQVR